MKAVFVGAGNLATNLGMSLMANGIDVVQVYSRTEDSASALSEKLKCAHTTDIDEVISDADIDIHLVFSYHNIIFNPFVICVYSIHIFHMTTDT